MSRTLTVTHPTLGSFKRRTHRHYQFVVLASGKNAQWLKDQSALHRSWLLKQQHDYQVKAEDANRTDAYRKEYRGYASAVQLRLDKIETYLQRALATVNAPACLSWHLTRNNAQAALRGFVKEGWDNLIVWPVDGTT